jgi:endonuclease/exonuclease/phosphatase family metal-dependent hydrolase
MALSRHDQERFWSVRRKSRGTRATRLTTVTVSVLALLLSSAGAHAVASTAGRPSQQGSVAAEAAGQQFYALDWNIAGATTHDGNPNQPNNYGSLAVVDRLASFASTWRPSVISVNEACDSQIDYLRERLADAGIQVQAWKFNQTQLSPACVLSGGSYAGNALLSMVPASDPADIYFDEDTGHIVSGRTSRGGACMTLHLTQNVRTCSFHLAQSHPAAVIEAQQFVATYGSDIAAHPYMLLGDFNATPNELLGTMYDPSAGGSGPFYEADMDSPNHGIPTEAGGKLDYAFVSSGHFARNALGTAIVDPGICQVENAFEPPWWVLYPHPCSDHKAIVASVTLGGSGLGNVGSR